MKEHLISILIALHAKQDFLFVVYMCVCAVILRTKDCDVLTSKLILYIATGISVLSIAAYLATLVPYLLYPSYLDHVEATVASIAWLGMHGHPLYPNWVSGDVYGSVYGPVLFLLHGLFLLIDPTITTSKVLGVVSLLIALGLIFIAAKQKVDNLTSFLLTASLVMLFAPWGPFAYWTRAEPFLIFISALSLLLAVKLPLRPACAMLGVLAGLATGFKLHGLIYVAPIAAMVIAEAKTARDRIILVILNIAYAVIFALLPFCLKESSLIGYGQYLSMAAHHGFAPDTFRANLLFALAIFSPIAAIWFWRKPALDPREFWLFAGLSVSVAMVVCVGSVSGGGPYHLLPFVPLCLYVATIMAAAPAGRSKPVPRETIAIIFLLLLLAYFPGGFIVNSRLLTDYYRNSRGEREKIIELQKYLTAYPDSQIGISDDEHYSDTYYRIFSIFQGHPLHVDFDAWADLAYVAGVDEKYVIRFIGTCEVPTWVLPLGAPFTELSRYTKQPILSNDFRRIFLMNYRLTQTGQAYQVWSCRSLRKERN
jgi:hypothetical protein